MLVDFHKILGIGELIKLWKITVIFRGWDSS